jgi:alkylation response protein AidB-like acyl-CoA dehydrogenase
MDFRLSEDQQALRDAAREYVRKRLRPLAEEVERTGEPPSHELIREYADMGFLGINVPTQYGGLGLSNIDALLVLEEFGKCSSAIAFPVFESCVGPVRAIERFASEELKGRIVPRVCRGELVVAVAMSEPHAGTALTDLTTRGTRSGEQIVLNGAKRWCSGGGHADGYLVYCRLNDDAGARGIGAIYVEKGTEGMRFGKPETLMGFRGVPSADIYFDNCVVPVANIIVPAGGFSKLMQAFDLERCGNATMALAQASGALADVLEYVQERAQFGKPLVNFQAVQMRLADMHMRVEAARLLIYRAAASDDDKMPSILDSSTAKCFANEIAREVCGNAVQLMGGYGYSKEYPMERRLRDAWGWSIAGGAVDIQKVNIAGALAGRRFDQRR